MVKLQLFPLVYILESPGVNDVSGNKMLGKTLTETLKFAKNRDFIYKEVRRKEDFTEALSASHYKSIWNNYLKKLADINKKSKGILLFPLPVIHFAAHGYSDEEEITKTGQIKGEGLSLTNDEEVTWKELYDLLQKIRESRELLLVTTDACLGLHGIEMAHYEKLPCDFFIGNQNEGLYPDLVTAFTVFFHNLSKITIDINLKESEHDLLFQVKQDIRKKIRICACKMNEVADIFKVNEIANKPEFFLVDCKFAKERFEFVKEAQKKGWLNN